MWETQVWSLGWEDPLENERLPLQYSGLESSMDCIVHGVAESWTQLSDFHYFTLRISYISRVATYNLDILLFPLWNQSVLPRLVLTVPSWPSYMFLRRQIRWSGIPISLRIFHSLMWSTQTLMYSQWSRSRCFSGTLLLFWWSNGCWRFDLWFLWLF